MTEPPLVSVVVPARNAEATLAETLACLARQTFADFEVLVVDDGSTDATARIASEHALVDARVRLLAGPRQGVSAARNVAIAAARGRWLLCLDSDDWVADHFLERMTGALAASPGALVAYCGYQRVMPGGALAPPENDPKVADAPFETFARTCSVAIHCVLVDRETVSRVGSFDPGLKTCEDWDLWQRVARTGGRWVHVDEVMSFYRTSPESLSRDGRQMLADSRTVIARGFAPGDAHAAPEHRAGASPALGSAQAAEAIIVLWWNAYDCGRGGAGSAPDDVSAVDPEWSWLGKMLIDAVACGLRAVPQQLAARWSEYGPSLAALLARVGRMWDDPLAARRLQYRFERALLDYDDLAAPRRLGSTLGLRVDLRAPPALAVPEGIDRLYVYLCDGAEVLRLIQIGALGTVTSRDWVRLAADFARVPRSHINRRLWLEHALRKARHSGSLALKDPRRYRDARERALLWQGARGWSLAHAPGSAEPGTHRGELSLLEREAAALASRAPRVDVGAARHGPRTDDRDPQGPDRRSYWEGTFERADPWSYDSPYEQEKYERQLRLLPEGTLGVVLELACAEGHLSRQLAPRCERLIATDISNRALSRARERCRGAANIEFKNLDLLQDPLPEALDAILCSEVLYYVERAELMRQIAGRIAAALKPGGYLLTAHALQLNDDPSRTGFDWPHPFGAASIAKVFMETPGLALDRSLQTELYRIDRFRRLAEGEEPPEATLEIAPITPDLEVDVARQVVWGGASARRTELAERERPQRLPVLMYHRIADAGPARLARYRASPALFEAQLRWLRQNGYHALVSEQLAWFIERGEPFYGRPVVITFDDGYQDFADHAWPLLQKHDFTAEVFIVTDLVGQSARWDAKAEEESAPLMDAATLARLQAEGAIFGSHLASHRPADALPTRELASELLRSRELLRQWLGKAPASFAAPYGACDERLRLLAAECGFRIGFSTDEGPAKLDSPLLHLPRVEVRGDQPLAWFIARMRELL